MQITDNFYKHYPTIQDAAMAIFFAVGHDEMIEFDVVEKLLSENPHLTITVEELAKQAVAYSRQFALNKERIISRLTSDRRIRNLSRNMTIDLPTTRISKIIIQEIDFIISNLCQMNYQDLFTKDYIETFIDLIDDENHLHNNFSQFIIQASQIDKKASDEAIAKLDQTVILYAKYLDHYLNEMDDLAQIREEIQSI